METQNVEKVMHVQCDFVLMRLSLFISLKGDETGALIGSAKSPGVGTGIVTSTTNDTVTATAAAAVVITSSACIL